MGLNDETACQPDVTKTFDPIKRGAHHSDRHPLYIFIIVYYLLVLLPTDVELRISVEVLLCCCNR